jgi:hypothetical protein
MRTLISSLIALCAGIAPLHADDHVIVHEWGTFTSLLSEDHQVIGGINVDDEPVPSFVYQEGGQVVGAQYSHDLGNFGLPPYSAGKGWAAGDPAVTMRLETPVIYIYPPKGQSPQSVPPLDVHVEFHGGFLTQFYPYAHAVPFNGLGQLTDKSTSSLDWAGVQLGSTEKPVEIDDKVWTTPREVSAPLLQVMTHFETGSGPDPTGKLQAEHFLFYRGVGHLNPPLIVAPNGSGVKAEMEIGSPMLRSGFAKFDDGWLVKIRPDGSCAFRFLDHPEPLPFMTMLTYWFPPVSASFVDSDFSADNLTKLKASMQDALVKEGLYPDEASAMLRTWELSYFKSPGLRFFYTVPRSWVDKVLPLQITGAPTDITRVMIGRVELITEEQRAALDRLAAGPCPDLPAVKNAAKAKLQNSNLPPEDVAAYYRGEKPLTDLGISIPPLIQDYLSLGRFRDALVMDEYWRKHGAAFAKFIRDNRIASLDPDPPPASPPPRPKQLPDEVVLRLNMPPGSNWNSPPP